MSSDNATQILVINFEALRSGTYSAAGLITTWNEAIRYTPGSQQEVLQYCLSILVAYSSC